MIRVVVLGSTGSIGRATLTVIARHPERFEVVGLAARRSVAELAVQASRTGARAVVLADESMKSRIPSDPTCDWHTGAQALVDMATRDDVDVVVNALVGAAGLAPTLAALEAGKRLALANKESLVAGGPLVLAAARRGGGELLPIDSEHSALLQCMAGSRRDAVARVVLTASGGPFRGWNLERLADVRPAEALRHPTWTMGAKITIDSATLANKALEVIEAHFLYGLEYDRIGVVVHPQSIVHSFVEFRDGSVLAQMGNPTMELPILYALTHPDRVDDVELRSYDPVASSPLTFEEVDHEAFPLFEVGVRAGRRGGVGPAAFNAGNEVAVQAFLDERIGFPDMARVVEESLSRVEGPLDTVQDVIEADAEARAVARDAVARYERSV